MEYYFTRLYFQALKKIAKYLDALAVLNHCYSSLLWKWMALRRLFDLIEIKGHCDRLIDSFSNAKSDWCFDQYLNQYPIRLLKSLDFKNFKLHLGWNFDFNY